MTMVLSGDRLLKSIRTLMSHDFLSLSLSLSLVIISGIYILLPHEPQIVLYSPPRPLFSRLVSGLISSKSDAMFPLLPVVFILSFLVMFCFRHMSNMFPSCVFLVPSGPDPVGPIPYKTPYRLSEVCITVSNLSGKIRK